MELEISVLVEPVELEISEQMVNMLPVELLLELNIVLVVLEEISVLNLVLVELVLALKLQPQLQLLLVLMDMELKELH